MIRAEFKEACTRAEEVLSEYEKDNNRDSEGEILISFAIAGLEASATFDEEKEIVERLEQRFKDIPENETVPLKAVIEQLEEIDDRVTKVSDIMVKALLADKVEDKHHYIDEALKTLLKAESGDDDYNQLKKENGWDK